MVRARKLGAEARGEGPGPKRAWPAPLNRLEWDLSLNLHTYFTRFVLLLDFGLTIRRREYAAIERAVNDRRYSLVMENNLGTGGQILREGLKRIAMRAGVKFNSTGDYFDIPSGMEQAVSTTLDRLGKNPRLNGLVKLAQFRVEGNRLIVDGNMNAAAVIIQNAEAAALTSALRENTLKKSMEHQKGETDSTEPHRKAAMRGLPDHPQAAGDPIAADRRIEKKRTEAAPDVGIRHGAAPPRVTSGPENLFNPPATDIVRERPHFFHAPEGKDNVTQGPYMIPLPPALGTVQQQPYFTPPTAGKGEVIQEPYKAPHDEKKATLLNRGGMDSIERRLRAAIRKLIDSPQAAGDLVAASQLARLTASSPAGAPLPEVAEGSRQTGGPANTATNKSNHIV